MMAEASTSMVRSGGPTSGGWWAAWIAVPDARLRPGVVRYSGFVSRSEVATVRREVPGAIVPVIIAFDAPYRVGGAEGAATAMRGAAGSRDARGGFDSFLAGMTSRPVLVEAGTVERCIQIDFTPPGMRRLLGVPMELVANQALELGEVLGPVARELAERLFEAGVGGGDSGGGDPGGWGARFRLVDELLLARLRATEPVVAEVGWAWGELVRTRGRARVGALTSELGWTRKRLGAAFRSEIGLPPKTVAFRSDPAAASPNGPPSVTVLSIDAAGRIAWTLAIEGSSEIEPAAILGPQGDGETLVALNVEGAFTVDSATLEPELTNPRRRAVVLAIDEHGGVRTHRSLPGSVFSEIHTLSFTPSGAIGVAGVFVGRLDVGGAPTAEPLDGDRWTDGTAAPTGFVVELSSIDGDVRAYSFPRLNSRVPLALIIADTDSAHLAGEFQTPLDVGAGEIEAPDGPTAFVASTGWTDLFESPR